MPLEVQGIAKRYGQSTALEGVSSPVREGEGHTLADPGSGKLSLRDDFPAHHPYTAACPLVCDSFAV
jgi:ABC-type branched-subunit amino acid transport system ATPase component